EQMLQRNRRKMLRFGPLRQILCCNQMSASLIGHSGSSAFRLSATAVLMWLAGSCFSSESAPRPFHHGIRGRGGTIFWSALPSDERQVQADIANSPHPSSREGHNSTARWSSSFLLSDVILYGLHAAAGACSRVHRNSVPSTHMRCYDPRNIAETRQYLRDFNRLDEATTTARELYDAMLKHVVQLGPIWIEQRGCEAAPRSRT